jgi:hypothetical protein
MIVVGGHEWYCEAGHDGYLPPRYCVWVDVVGDGESSSRHYGRLEGYLLSQRNWVWMVVVADGCERMEHGKRLFARLNSQMNMINAQKYV